MLADDVRVPLANVAHYDTGEGFGRRLPHSLPLTTHPSPGSESEERRPPSADDATRGTFLLIDHCSNVRLAAAPTCTLNNPITNIIYDTRLLYIKLYIYYTATAIAMSKARPVIKRKLFRR